MCDMKLADKLSYVKLRQRLWLEDIV